MPWNKWWTFSIPIGSVGYLILPFVSFASGFVSGKYWSKLSVSEIIIFKVVCFLFCFALTIQRSYRFIGSKASDDFDEYSICRRMASPVSGFWHIDYIHWHFFAHGNRWTSEANDDDLCCWNFVRKWSSSIEKIDVVSLVSFRIAWIF